MDEQKIIFSNRFEKEKFEDYKTDLGTDSSVTPDFTEADDFFKFIQKNRRSVPSKERIADKDKFIKTVYELSNSFEIDADLIEFAEGYIANIYVDYACYTGYIKKLLAILFILADDISFLDGSKENADMLFSFTYHTHHIFLNNRETEYRIRRYYCFRLRTVFACRRRLSCPLRYKLCHSRIFLRYQRGLLYRRLPNRKR